MGRSPTRMKPIAPRRAAAAAVAIALVSLMIVPSARADSWKPDTSCADKFKLGKSGQMYSWRKGTC